MMHISQSGLNLQLVASFIVLCCAGIINAGYLFWKHREKKPLVCPLHHDCSVVTESKWSHILYIRNEVLGMLFFLIVLGAMVYVIITPSFAPQLLMMITVAVTGGLMFSIVLVLIQMFIIKDYCFYCLISVVISVLIFVNSLLLLTTMGS